MSATLVAKNLTAAHGARVLFSGLDLTVAPGDVIGLVGANGAGKSTLLGLLAAELAPDEGSVTLAPATATVGHLPQEHERRAGETVAGFLARRTGVAQADAALESSATALGEGAPGSDDAYAVALDRWLALGAADFAERTASVLADLGLDIGVDSLMTSLSGGQAARAGLAALLLSRYDVFLLDEPTNDLDLDGLDRLERFVSGLRAGVVVVSHDREFLTRTVTSVVEIDRAQQQVSVFGGSYESYLEEREVARRHAREAYDEYADTRAELEGRKQMQRQWATSGVARAKKNPKDNDKAQQGFFTNRTEKQASKVRATERLIERLDVAEEPRKEWVLKMEIAAAPRSGSVAATLRGAVVRRGDFTLGPVDLQIDWADRVVITGANGSGKSTLLAVLLGRLAPDEGAAALGSGVQVGEIDQARAVFMGEQPLARTFGDLVPEWPDADVRTLLAKFGLGSDQAVRPTSTLSPGERTRAGLALLQARGVNLLVLDEPTNHLDLPAIEQLEQALESFTGTVLLVTHDRRMLSSVRTTRRLAVDAGQVRDVT